jgi:hypothetical protein
MADDPDASGETGSDGASPRPLAGATSVPREKPVIEGHAEEIAVEELRNAAVDAAEVPPAEDLINPLPSPGLAEVAEPMPASDIAEPVPEPTRKTRGAPLWPFAVAIVVAALLAVGGAFALHMLDKTPANLDSLDARITALEHRRTEASSAGETALEARIAALESASHDAQSAMAGLRTDLDKLAAQKASASSPAPDLAPLEARLGVAEQKLTALESKVNGLAVTLNAEKGQVNATATRVTQSAAASADSEAVAILAANLLRKVESGAAYDADLAALANRGLDKGKLAPLEESARTGVATPAALAKQFFDLSPAMLSAEPQPKENGFLNHLVNDAERLVRVRKVGDTSGDDLSGRVARIQESLDVGAVETAYQDWNALPDAAKAKSENFGEAAKGRLDALAAARSIDADAVAALGRARS